MKSKWIVLIIIVVAIVIFFTQRQGVGKLVSPNLSQTSKQTIEEVPNATPNAPKSYNFDSSSDLKKELDSINPQILDSDFE